MGQTLREDEIEALIEEFVPALATEIRRIAGVDAQATIGGYREGLTGLITFDWRGDRGTFAITFAIGAEATTLDGLGDPRLGGDMTAHVECATDALQIIRATLIAVTGKPLISFQS